MARWDTSGAVKDVCGSVSLMMVIEGILNRWI